MNERESLFDARSLAETVKAGIWCPTMGADAVYAAEKALDALVERAQSRAYFESIHGDIYLWRIGEQPAEKALEAIDEWLSSVEKGEMK